MGYLLVQDIVKMAEKQLKEAGVPNAKGDAEDIYCFLKRVDRSKFFMEWSESADDRTCEQYFQLIERRRNREPLQHITGSQDFMGITLKVDSHVLIPRLDTEVVVEKAEELFNSKKGDTVLDLCCGSGAIGIAMAKRCNAKVTCVDISSIAKKLTEDNASTHNVKLNVLCGDLYEPVKRKKYHMIISNPPYIKTQVMDTLMPEVKDFEPINALDGGHDGLDFYRRIISSTPEHLKKDGILVLEIGHDQGDDIMALLTETQKFFDLQVYKDLGDNDRVITARLLGKK